MGRFFNEVLMSRKGNFPPPKELEKLRKEFNSEHLDSQTSAESWAIAEARREDAIADIPSQKPNSASRPKRTRRTRKSKSK